MALTQRAHQLISQHFDGKTKSLAVDATCGNGHDTEFLYNLGFKKIYGFDVQQSAINSTQHRFAQDTRDSLSLILAGHERMGEFVDEQIDCVMFNFGYLPTGDKQITTNAHTSIDALNIATKLLNPDGVVSLLCYPGHPSGALETQAIKDWFTQLHGHWAVEIHLAKSPKPTAPILYLLKRTNA